MANNTPTDLSQAVVVRQPSEIDVSALATIQHCNQFPQMDATTMSAITTYIKTIQANPLSMDGLDFKTMQNIIVNLLARVEHLEQNLPAIVFRIIEEKYFNDIVKSVVLQLGRNPNLIQPIITQQLNYLFPPAVPRAAITASPQAPIIATSDSDAEAARQSRDRLADIARREREHKLQEHRRNLMNKRQEIRIAYSSIGKHLHEVHPITDEDLAALSIEALEARIEFEKQALDKAKLEYNRTQRREATRACRSRKRDASSLLD